MPLKIVRNDITKMQVEAIVNTANAHATVGPGCDSAVYKAAGYEQLLKYRIEKIGIVPEGEVFITPGFELQANYIIHAVSPLYRDGNQGEEEKLRSCYKKSLQLAKEYHIKSIAFPLISTGGFGYPKEEGMRIALDEINAFLLKNDMLIYLVVFDTEATKLGQNLYPELEAYIDYHYVCKKREDEYGDEYFAEDVASTRDEIKTRRRGFSREDAMFSMNMMPSVQADYCFLEQNESALNERMRHMSDTFQQYLLYLIEMKGLTNAEVYKRAIITKQLFSKIKLNTNYHPDKATAMRLCIGAKLNLDETKDLLARAGYALSPCDKRDIIFSFFIEHEVFDMIEIDIALEEHGLPCFIE